MVRIIGMVRMVGMVGKFKDIKRFRDQRSTPVLSPLCVEHEHTISCPKSTIEVEEESFKKDQKYNSSPIHYEPYHACHLGELRASQGTVLSSFIKHYFVSLV